MVLLRGCVRHQRNVRQYQHNIKTNKIRLEQKIYDLSLNLSIRTKIGKSIKFEQLKFTHKFN